MKLHFMVFKNKWTGGGHYYRSEELARVAIEKGHTIRLTGDSKFPFLGEENFCHMDYRDNSKVIYYTDSDDDDWIIFDLPFTPSFHKGKAKICALNGIGHSLEAEKSDLVIIQGFSDRTKENVLSGPPYVILRKNINRFPLALQNKLYDWFVWGGSQDRMELLPTIFSIYGKKGIYARIKSTDSRFTIPKKPDHLPLYMFSSRKAIIAMGMVAWELVYLGIPTYAFSETATHLAFAKEMDNVGLIKAWPEVGVPPISKIKKFLSGFNYVGANNRPDLYGASRILKELELRL